MFKWGLKCTFPFPLVSKKMLASLILKGTGPVMSSWQDVSKMHMELWKREMVKLIWASRFLKERGQADTQDNCKAGSGKWVWGQCVGVAGLTAAGSGRLCQLSLLTCAAPSTVRSDLALLFMSLSLPLEAGTHGEIHYLFLISTLR